MTPPYWYLIFVSDGELGIIHMGRVFGMLTVAFEAVAEFIRRGLSVQIRREIDGNQELDYRA
jgi:hypothetical protein